MDHAVDRGGHPPIHGMTDPPLDILDGPSRIALVPSPIEGFGDDSELDDQIGGEVLVLDFATFFPPQAEQGVFVGAHDDTGIGTADEVSAAFPGGWSRGNICSQIDRHGESLALCSSML